MVSSAVGTTKKDTNYGESQTGLEIWKQSVTSGKNLV